MFTSDPKHWMWTEACVLLERADRLRNQFFEPVLSTSDSTSWSPPLDIYENEQEIWVFSALPGVASDDINVYMEADCLVVTGHRPLPDCIRGAAIHRMEIPHGRFERRIRLSNMNLTVDAMKFENGFLSLRLKKTG